MLASLEKFYHQLNFNPETRLVIAVSGGIDSTLLLEMSAELFHNRKLPGVDKILCVHVNHGLRGMESDGDEAFVQALATRLGVECESRSVVWQANEKKSQASCRDKREEFYSEFLSSEQDFLLLAHHADDLAETLFLRLLRGTGVSGMQPMSAVQGNRLRPFLVHTRAEICKEAEYRKLQWREDSSNLSSKYERNWLRNELFPQLEEKRPGFAKRLIAFANEVTELKSKNISAPVFVSYLNQGALYRREDLLAIDSAALHELFQINRLHTEKVRSFLDKDSGKYSLPGAFLWNSCGLIWAGKGEIPSILPQANRIASPNFSSILGRWALTEPSHGSLRAYVVGESRDWKDELIENRVPAFFRTGIPVLENGEEAELLVPSSLSQESVIISKLGLVSFSPSSFARDLASELHFQFE